MMNELILLSGANIPFIEATATIHQPSIYEISMIGEDNFFTGCELLKFSKDILNDEDKSKLLNYSDFYILMSIINDKSGSMRDNISCAKQVLELIFPFYQIQYSSSTIDLMDKESQVKCGELNEENFSSFKEILIKMFCLSHQVQQEYNAQGELAKKIAEKFKQRRQQLAELKSSKQKKIAIFSRYISILTVGEHKDMNSFMKYTVYQLFDEFQRYELKVSYDVYFKARMAGAKDLEEPEDWKKNLHE